MAAIQERCEIQTEHTWDLSLLFKDQTKWEDAFIKAKSRISEISDYRGKLSQSLKALSSGLDCYFSISEAIERLYVYAHLLSDQDTRNSEASSILQRTQSLYTEFGAASSFISPELMEAPVEFITKALSDPALKIYHRFLKDLEREKAHIRNSSEEEILSLAGEVLGSSRKIFGQLNDADLCFEDVNVKGEEKPLTHGSYITFLLNTDRSVRKDAFSKYYQSFQNHQYTLSATMNANLKKDTFLARVRKFPSSRAKSLFSDNIPESLYDSLIKEVGLNLSGSLHKYYELRKTILGLEDQRIFDTYVPLVKDAPKGVPYEEGVEIIAQALKPLGQEYVETLIRGLGDERWVDRYENAGKRSGAYSSGCYGSAPYILMNYKESSIESLFTLAHEAGHSMHTWYANRTQPYANHGYTIFVAEVASTCNEILLSNYLLNLNKNNNEMRLYLLNYKLDAIKTTFFRQTMFAEFEQIIHTASDNSEPLTANHYRRIYRELLSKYFGESVTLGELDDLECFRIPHFYSSFYVFKYATGLAAAFDLSQKIYAKDENAIRAYIEFLSSGGSKYPLEALKDAGCNLQKPEPVNTTITIFQQTLAEVSKILTSSS